MKKIIDNVKDKIARHKERHTSLDYHFLFSDSITFINQNDWNKIASEASIFLSQKYLKAIEDNSPENTSQKYAMAYHEGNPVVIIACQVAEISGENLIQTDTQLKETVAKTINERILVCGNLVSSGLHGVAFSKDIDPETGWRIVAEILYKIRRAEKLSGNIDFVLIKDLKGEALEASQIIERFSYRRIQTDPDMVLDLSSDILSFDDYLGSLTSKYRSRIKKVIKTLDQADFECNKITITEEIDKELHRLYLAVEEKSATRLATLPEGYFLALQNALKDKFTCFAIQRQNEIAGFVTVIKDHDKAIAYYVGLNYKTNSEYPIYFRLLQLVIQSAIDMECTQVMFGRTALEPKASLGAKPVDTFVWARHRVPAVNFFVRKLFRNVPFDTAPERSVTKK